mgnify:CR=1 FL=1
MTGETDLQNLISHMRPMLDPEPYVFCTFATKSLVELAEYEPIGLFSETEGMTAILPLERARELGLAEAEWFRRITLTVHSSLEAVGLTAAVAKALAEGLKLPVWLGSLGTFLTSMLAGPVAGAISGFINNVIYGLTLSPISTVYAITSIGIGIAVGVLHANGWFSSARRVFVSAIIIAIVSAVISTPLNVIFWGGQTGIAWGDSLFAVMVANHVPVWLASFTDEFVLDVLDKVCVAYLAFFIYRQLPKRMVHFFSDDK